MGGGDNGCGNGLLGVTSNKLATFPRQNRRAYAAPSGECNYYIHFNNLASHLTAFLA